MQTALPPTAGLSGNTLPLVARPRLVAKSISGHRASAPKSASLASRNGGGSGPDPNQVWNRNRRMIRLPSMLCVATDITFQLLLRQRQSTLPTRN